MDALLTRLAAELADRYAFERELGHGGMATVWLAEDIRHHRKVAIKVFRPEIAAALGVDRFLREIDIAARLQHPNVLALFDSGEAGGLLYYVMPYVEGLSLRQRLDRERQLSMDTVLRLTREVSQALAHAHSRGIVHRDIKPENILLSSDAALVADFGIAHAMEQAGGERLTSTGFAVGTPRYMSPEQGMGGGVDGRSDLYSLACVVYEMLGGEPPFSGTSPAALLARHTVDPVPHLRTLRQTVPPAMEAIIEQALAKAPADRQSGVAEFSSQLSGAATGAISIRTPIGAGRKIRWGIAALGVAVLAVLAVLAVVFLQKGGPPTSGDARPRLAVLPFESIGRPDDRYVADGVTDEITNRMAGMSGILVIARSSVMPLVQAGRSVRDIASELGVGYVLTGSVKTDRKPDGSGEVRVTPQLVRTADEVAVWGNGYDAALAPGDLLNVLAAIADRVAKALNVSLLLPEQMALAARPTDNLAAYEAYLRGNINSSQSFSEKPWREAVEMYQQAVTEDPRFALAWAKLSQAHTRYFYNFDRSTSRLNQARAALDRAFALDSTLLEGRLANGLLYYLGYLDYDRAEQEFEAVRRQGPNNSEVLSYLATIQRRRGRFDEATDNLRRAAELDPRSQLYPLELASTHIMLRRFSEAEQELNRAVGLAPDGIAPRIIRSYVYWAWKGDLERARAAMRETLEAHSMRELLAYMLPFNPQYILTLGGEFQDSLDVLVPGTPGFDPGLLYLARGLSLQRRGDGRARAYFDSSRAVWEGRARDRPLEWTVHARLGLSLAGLGRTGEALREGRAAVDLLPLSRDAQGGTYPLSSMVTIAILSGELDTAVAYLRPLLEHPSQFSPNLLRHDPLFDPLRDKPGFRQLAR